MRNRGHTFDIALNWDRGSKGARPHVLRVKGTAQPSIPARVSGPPDSWSPAEGGEIEDTEVYLVRHVNKLATTGSSTYTVVKHERRLADKLETKLWDCGLAEEILEELAEMEQAAMEDAYDRRHDI